MLKDENTSAEKKYVIRGNVFFKLYKGASVLVLFLFTFVVIIIK